MKISSASKKVLASALSAAMVVAFAPTVAMGADLGGTSSDPDLGEAAVQVTYTENGVSKAEKFSLVSTDGAYNDGIQGAFDFAAAKSGTVQLLGDITADVVAHGTVTIDLNGHTWSDAGDYINKAGTAVVEMNGAPITVNGDATTTVVGKKAQLVAATAYNAPAVILVKDTDQISNVNVDGYLCTSSQTGDTREAGKFYTTEDGTDEFTLVASKRVVVDGVYYNTLAKPTAAGASYEGLFTVATEVVKKTLKAGNITIKDTSEAKTGKVDGNYVDVINTDGDEVKKAGPAVTVNANGTLTIKGGTFTTGTENAVYEDNAGMGDGFVQKAIAGNVASMENATVEAFGGSRYINDTCEHVKPIAVEAVSVTGAVKNSKIVAVAADASEKVTTAGDPHNAGAASAVALKVGGAVENTVAEATAGKVAKDAAAQSTAIAIQSTAASGVTYKMVTATAVANGSSENKAAVTGTSAASTATAIDGANVTIWSGKYTGERANAPFLKGGEFSKHINIAAGAAEIDTDHFATVCLGVGKSDFVVPVLAATATGDVTDGAATAYGNAVSAATNNAIQDAVASAATHKVGVTYATGYDAAALAAAATDYAVSQYLGAYADVQAAAAAKVAEAGKTLTDEEVAFNKAVADIDAAAKEANKVAFSYVNATGGIVYNDPAKATVRGYKGTPVLALTDLGLVKGTDTTTGDSHATTISGTLVPNAYGYETALKKSNLIAGTAKDGLTTATKTAATANAFGTGFEEIAASEINKVTDFFTTKLGAFTVLSTNAGQVEEIVDPAPEKATQAIEVEQKSMTVKVGAKKKTSKGKSFNLGATAETAVTASKKSGSSKITVTEAGKVKLAKGAVKGKTYTAKVSLKAAGSDAYLAAAKTITVKFTIKK